MSVLPVRAVDDPGHIADTNALHAAHSSRVRTLVPTGLVGNGSPVGSAGNSAAINAAINACSAAGGGAVYLPKPATAYHLTYDTLLAGTDTYAAIILKSNVALIREPGTKITAPPTGPGTYRVLICIGDNVTDANNCGVFGLDIDGQQTALSNLEDQHGIGVAGGKNIRIEGNNIHNLRGDAVSTGEFTTQSSDGVWVTGNKIHDCVGNAVATHAPVGETAKNWDIGHNHCRTSLSNWSVAGPGAAESMIFEARSSGFRVHDNICEDWGLILLHNTDDMKVTNNTVRPAVGGKGGILLDGGNTNIGIEGNTIDVSASEGAGVQFENNGNSVVTVAGNLIKRNPSVSITTGGGVRVATDTVANLAIHENIIYGGGASDGSPDIGIVSVGGGGGWVRIADNICLSATTAIFSNADGTVVSDNICTNGGIVVVSDDATVTGNLVTAAAAPVFFYTPATGTALTIVDSPGASVSGNFLAGGVLSVAVSGTTDNAMVTGNRITKGTSGFHIVEYAGDGNRYVPNFFMGTPVLQWVGANSVAVQTITGSRGGNAALASLLTALDKLQLIDDATTA